MLQDNIIIGISSRSLTTSPVAAIALCTVVIAFLLLRNQELTFWCQVHPAVPSLVNVWAGTSPAGVVALH